MDNFVRRQYDYELGTSSLVPISHMQRRVKAWEEISGLTIETFIGDLTDATFVNDTLRTFRPDAIVHFAEQRSAPYSMIDRGPRRVHPGEQRRRARSTCSTRSPRSTRRIHLVKLGHHG